MPWWPPNIRPCEASASNNRKGVFWPVIFLGVSTLSPASPSCCKILCAASQRWKEQISARVAFKIVAKWVLCHINYHIMIINVISYLIHISSYIHIWWYIYKKKTSKNVPVVILSSFRVGPCRPRASGLRSWRARRASSSRRADISPLSPLHLDIKMETKTMENDKKMYKMLNVVFLHSCDLFDNIKWNLRRSVAAFASNANQKQKKQKNNRVSRRVLMDA